MDQSAPMEVSHGLDLSTILARFVKYLVEGGAVALAVYFIPTRKPDIQEVAMIAVTAAAVFAVLDRWAPQVGIASRQGAGFGIGAAQVGFQGITGLRLPGVPPPFGM